jgi:hypothetical protein
MNMKDQKTDLSNRTWTSLLVSVLLAPAFHYLLNRLDSFPE